MISEMEFMNEIAGIILSVFNGKEKYFTKENVCRDGHFSPKMLVQERLLRMRGTSLLRLMLYIASAMSREEFDKLTLKLSRYITDVANDEDFSAYTIIDSHAGSPIERRLQ